MFINSAESFFQMMCVAVFKGTFPFIYLKHFKGRQQFTSFIGASVDLKPFQARSFIIFFTKEYIRLAYGPSQEFSFANLKSEKEKKLKKRLAILSKERS